MYFCYGLVIHKLCNFTVSTNFDDKKLLVKFLSYTILKSMFDWFWSPFLILVWLSVNPFSTFLIIPFHYVPGIRVLSNCSYKSWCDGFISSHFHKASTWRIWATCIKLNLALYEMGMSVIPLGSGSTIAGQMNELNNTSVHTAHISRGSIPLDSMQLKMILIKLVKNDGSECRLSLIAITNCWACAASLAIICFLWLARAALYSGVPSTPNLLTLSWGGNLGK